MNVTEMMQQVQLVCVCSVVPVQVIQERVLLSPGTSQHLSSPFLLQKNRDRREESQPERACKLELEFSFFPSVVFLSNFGAFCCLAACRLFVEPFGLMIPDGTAK